MVTTAETCPKQAMRMRGYVDTIIANEIEKEQRNGVQAGQKKTARWCQSPMTRRRQKWKMFPKGVASTSFSLVVKLVTTDDDNDDRHRFTLLATESYLAFKHIRISEQYK